MDTEQTVRLVSGTTWECTACGERLDIPRGKKPISMLVTTAGDRQRIITVDGKVIHRCRPDVGEPLPLGARPGCRHVTPSRPRHRPRARVDRGSGHGSPYAGLVVTMPAPGRG